MHRDLVRWRQKLALVAALAALRCAPSPLAFESPVDGSADAADAAADVATCALYRDQDGDGFAPEGAPVAEDCAPSDGWVLPRDTDGDGLPNWDCDDTDEAVHPEAPDPCDEMDNDCSGFADESCPEPCPGIWPIEAGDWVTPQIIDLDGDGTKEIVFTTVSSTNPGIRNLDGSNASDGPPATHWTDRTFADLDGDFSVEIVQADGIWRRGPLGFLKLAAYGAGAGDAIDKASVSDLNGDGNLDVFGYRCEDDSGNPCTTAKLPTGFGCRPLVWMLRTRQPGALSGELVRLPRPPGGPWAGCGAGPTALDLDGNGVEDILFTYTHTDDSGGAVPRDGRLYIYECADAPSCETWSAKAISTGHDSCGGWWDQRLWVGDATGTGASALFIPYSDPACKVSPAVDPLTGGELLSNVWLYDTGPADLDGNGKFDDLTDRVSPLDLDGDGRIDTGRFEGDLSSAVLGGYVDGPSASAPWMPGWPEPGARAMVADDLDGDGRVEVITHDTYHSQYSAWTGKANCFRLGVGSWRPETLLGQMFTGLTPLQRNGKIDNFEPNDVVRWAASGEQLQNLATRYVLPPGHDLYRALISRPGDVDWYEASATKWTSKWSAELWVPDGKDYTVAIGCESKSKAGAPATGVEPAIVAEGTESERMRAGTWWKVDLGDGATNPAVAALCATSSRYFVGVWSRSREHFGTRPYLLRVGR